MSRWYRAYEGTVTDPKLGEVALVAGCSRSVAIATWHAILESCAVTNDGGRFEATPRRIAVALGEPVATIEAAFAEMAALGMIKQDSERSHAYISERIALLEASIAAMATGAAKLVARKQGGAK